MQFRKSFELKTVGESTENIPYVLVLFTAFPRDPVGTQNVGPGEPLVWLSMAAVNRAFHVVCLFSRHTVCSITISMICFRNSELPACGVFFPMWRNFPPVVWTHCLLFLSDDLFSSFCPRPHPGCKLSTSKDNYVTDTVSAQCRSTEGQGQGAMPDMAAPSCKVLGGQVPLDAVWWEPQQATHTVWR